VVHGDAFFYALTRQTSRWPRHSLPAIYAQREFGDDGGSANYGANSNAANRIACGIGRIQTERPADLPVRLSTTIGSSST
jgi:hypothetical protein